MKRLLGLVMVCSALAAPSFAQTCKENVAALFKDGPINPFNRPAWRETTKKINEDKSETHVVDATWQSPSRVRSFSNNNHIIAIGAKTWMSESQDGPWTSSGATLPADVEDFHKRTNEMLVANMTDVACPGTETLMDREVTRYIYRSVTDPNEYGSWFGGLFNAFIDMETGLLVRLEISESVSSWDPEPAKFMTITTYEYDESITIDPPVQTPVKTHVPGK